MSLIPNDSRVNTAQQPSFYSSPMPVSATAGPAAGPANGGIDLLGPFARRKFLIILLMIVGAVIGFLVCQNTAPTYESVTRLMITSQTPAVIDGNMTSLSQVSIPRQHRLLISQMVLENAISDGGLQDFETFREEESIFAALAGEILKVEYSTKETDDTMQISAVGENAEELPLILQAVVSSYEAVLRKQSVTSGDENVALISQLRSKLESEKNSASEEYLAILAKLNLPGLEKNGVPTNPYVDSLESLRTDRSRLVTELREITGRLGTAEKAVASDNPSQMNYLSTEAKKFLAVEIDTLESIEDDNRNGGTSHILAQHSNQIFDLERQLRELQIRRAALARTLGKKHPSMRSNEEAIQAIEKQLELVKEIYEKSATQTLATVEDEEALRARLEERNRQWISIYLNTLRAEKSRMEVELSQLDGELVQLEEKAKSVSNDIMKLQLLKKQIAEKQANIDEVVARLSEVNVVASNFNETKVELIDPPSQASLVGPSKTKYVGAGLLAGGVLGALLVLIVDMADQTFRNPGEIFQKLGVPVLAKLPPVRMPKKTANGISPSLISMHSPNSQGAEAIRAVRTSMLFTAQAEGYKVFMLTSPSPGDGKSTTVINLAVSMAQAGKSVVLVDADFRRPRVHAYYGQSLEPGVVQALTGTEDLEDCLQPCPQYENLSLLCAGGRPTNPGEIVTSQAFGDLIDELRGRFDIVLIDSPPVLPVADATMISSHVDGVYMVMRIRKGVAVTSTKAKEKLDLVQARLLGVIVNGVDDNPHYNEYGSYGYSYGYSNVGNGKYYESRNSRYQEKIGSTP